MKTPVVITRRVIIANTLAFMATFLLLGAGLYFVDQRDAERQRDICGLIVLLDVPPAAPLPDTPAGQRQGRILAAMHAYRLRIGC